jgi:hypothetical protein
MHRYATSTLLYVSIAILPKSVSARGQCFATCAHSRISQTWRGDHKCNACLRRTGIIAILPKSVSAPGQCFATCAHSSVSQTWRGDHKCNACLRRTHMSHSLIPTPLLAHACISGPALRRGVFFQVPVAVQSLLSERGARCWQN